MKRMLKCALVAALVVPLSGCYPKGVNYELVRLYMIMKILYPDFGGGPAKGSTKIDTSVDVDISADVGGLDGTYDVTVSIPGEGAIGTFTGTGTVKGGRFVTIKDDGSQELLDIVDTLAERVTGVAVTVTSAKAKVKAWQTPGGVEAGFRAKISWQGTVDSGPAAGQAIKGGKITAEDVQGGV